MTDIRQALSAPIKGGKRLSESLLERRVADLANEPQVMERQEGFGSGLRAALDRTLQGTPLGHERPEDTLLG